MFSNNSKVRYSEVDCDRRLTIPATVNYLQDTCVFHSESVGAGLDYVESTGRVWLLGAWRIEFLEDINFMDNIKISTWPYRFKSFFGYRNLTIEKVEETDAGRSKVCVRADSEWMLYSIKDKRLVRAEEQDIKFYPCEDALEMDKCKRKLTTDKILQSAKPVVVGNSMIDTNGHVNNEKYIQLSLETVQFENKVKILETEYKRQARLGDIIVPFYYVDEYEAFISLRDSEDNVYANIRLTFAN